MQRLAYACFMLLTLMGCAPKGKDNGFVDPEVMTKDGAFRNTIKTGDFVKLGQGYTYYEYENRDADTLLVMVHGFSVPSYIWDSTYHAALSRGHGALRYDAYGRGYSDNPNVVYDVALYSSQLEELLRALHIDKKINLLGLSYGGVVVTAFAFQYPDRVRNLIYVDPVGFETTTGGGQHPAMVTEQQVRDYKQSESYASMAKGQLGDFYDAAPFAGWDARFEEMMKFKGFARALLSTRLNIVSMENEQRKIAGFGLPVFAIWGAHDAVVKLGDARANLMERIPQVELFVLPHAGHLPHMEQTTMFNSILFDQIICCAHR
ncbi:MAG: alpha/beta hydrolase [Cyclobacteriaceae bacterium]|nr:alpha/beta hydrolase [Cyclobacteriaceae bacterium]